MTTKKLLILRKEISKRRPEFVMQDQHKRPDLQRRWRKPKGMHSKMRHGVWGRPASVNVGYRGPAAVRGLHHSGLIPVLIHTPNDIAALDSKTQGALIAHIGNKKKAAVLTACKQKGIIVLNIKNVDETIQQIAADVTSRKEAKKATTRRREERAKAKAPKAEKKEEAQKTKEEERKEAEKVIIRKEG